MSLFITVNSLRASNFRLFLFKVSKMDDLSPTYYAVQLHWKCEDSAAQFIHDVLKLDWAKGGGGLIVKRQLPTSEIFFYFS